MKQPVSSKTDSNGSTSRRSDIGHPRGRSLESTERYHMAHYRQVTRSRHRHDQSLGASWPGPSPPSGRKQSRCCPELRRSAANTGQEYDYTADGDEAAAQEQKLIRAILAAAMPQRILVACEIVWVHHLERLP